MWRMTPSGPMTRCRMRSQTTAPTRYATWQAAWSAWGCLGSGLCGLWGVRTPAGGCLPQALNELYRSCDALLNIGGATDLCEWHLAAPFRVYVETDPVISELQLANDDEHTRLAFANHHAIVTYGENYGAPDCGVPLNGITYGKTRQPIDLDLWPMAYDPGSTLLHDHWQLPACRQRRDLQR